MKINKENINKLIKRLFRKTSTKIALGIVFITVIVLLAVSYMIFFRTSDDFNNVIYTYGIPRRDGSVQNVKVLLPVDPDSPIGQLQQEFNQRLTMALIVGGVIGVGLASLAGFFFSKIITRPLNHIRTGIINLRQNNKKVQLLRTGEEEFDLVIDEFNTLVRDLDYQEELRNNLISDVAHELKTPITALSGQLQAVKDGVLELDNKRIDILMSEMKRLIELTDNLNDFTHVQSSLPNLQKEDIDLNLFVEDLNKYYEALLKNKNINLINSIPTEYKINADKNLLKRVLNNLLDNAIAYSDGTEIKIYIENNALVVEDNGKGIDKEFQDKIFERFYRVEQSRNRKTGGLGLGLAMVKEIVEAHGWKITVVSLPEFQGTKFVIGK